MTDVEQPGGAEPKSAETPPQAVPSDSLPADVVAPLVSIDIPSPPPPAPVAQALALRMGPVFAPDTLLGEDTMGLGVSLDHVAELVAHAGAGTPLAVGLFGAAGAGKSFALAKLISRVEGLAAGAAKLGGRSPYVARILVARVDANQTGDAPAAMIATALYRSLSGAAADGTSYTALAQEANHAIRDPHVVAREAGERLMETRRRLDTERQVLDDLTLRRSRLTENVLYESAGSRIEAYARTNRARIEARLRGFGFTDEDPTTAYKGLVREVAENGSVFSRISAFLQAIVGFSGQGRLMVTAVVFAVLAWLIGYAETNQQAWLAWMTSNGGAFASVASWSQAHPGLLPVLRQGASIVAVVALALDLIRAFRFLQPVFRGASFLNSDLDGRRRDLESLIAHQTQRVDSLVAEAEAHARRAEEAERRAANVKPGAALDTAMPEDPFDAEPAGTDRDRLAGAFIASLDPKTRGKVRNGNAPPRPERIVVAFDNLDRLSAAQAAAIVETANGLLAGTGFVTVFAADPAQLIAAWGEQSAEKLEKFVQIPVHLPESSGSEASRLAHALLWPDAGASRPSAPDASRSALDRPISAQEGDLVEQLAPLAGRTPRRIKRFVNLYRLARARLDDYGSLAFMLALQIGGTREEHAAMESALATLPAEASLSISADEPRLTEALQCVARVRGSLPTVSEAVLALHIAQTYRVA